METVNCQKLPLNSKWLLGLDNTVLAAVATWALIILMITIGPNKKNNSLNFSSIPEVTAQALTTGQAITIIQF